MTTMTRRDGQKVQVTIPEDDREMENALDALALAAYGALNSGKIPEPFRAQLQKATERAMKVLGANPKIETRDLKQFEKAIEAWAKRGREATAKGNAEMAQVYERDFWSLKAIYNDILAGNYISAGRLANSLDTLVRDQIPTRLYNAIVIGS